MDRDELLMRARLADWEREIQRAAQGRAQQVNQEPRRRVWHFGRLHVLLAWHWQGGKA